MITEKRIQELKEEFIIARSQEEWVDFYQRNFGSLLSTIEDLWPIARAASRWVRAAAGREAAQAEDDLQKALEVMNRS